MRVENCSAPTIFFRWGAVCCSGGLRPPNRRSEIDATGPANLVYRELRRLAQRYMRHERPGHTLQTTALVNEAYLRLVDAGKVNFQDRAHFFAVSAQVMRRILVEFARRHGSQKRGGEVERVSLEESLVVYGERGADLVALDDALQALAALDARRSRVVELRFFGGLSVEETAAVLKVSPETVMHDWKLAKAWLRRAMNR
jgi:RNA polymerase sigma-70 factor (ECF subfamily)